MNTHADNLLVSKFIGHKIFFLPDLLQSLFRRYIQLEFKNIDSIWYFNHAINAAIARANFTLNA
jgi:hypothetical protein